MEVIVAVSTCFVTTNLLHQHQKPKDEDLKHTLEQDDGKDSSGGEKKTENPIIDVVEHDTGSKRILGEIFAPSLLATFTV